LSHRALASVALTGQGLLRMLTSMSNGGRQRPHLTRAGAAASVRRQERLAAALRANLARRKAQSRARQEPPPSDPAKPRD
jgi:hypothetical protein